MGKNAKDMIHRIVKAMKIPDFFMSFGVILLGYFLSVYENGWPDIGIWSLIPPFLLFGSSAFITNDYFDFEHDTGRPDKKNTIDKKKMLAYSWLALAGGIIFLRFLPPLTTVLFLISYFLSYVYSGKPFRAKEKPFIDVGLHGVVAALLLPIGYSISGHLSASAAYITVVFLCLFANAAIFQQIRDYSFDKRSKFKTTVITLGPERSIVLSKILMALAATVFLFSVQSFFPRKLALLSLTFVPYFFLRKNSSFFEDSQRATAHSMALLALLLGVIAVLP